MGPSSISTSIFRLRCVAALRTAQFQRNAMKPAGTKENSTNVAHKPHNEVECLSSRCQLGHCFGGSTVNKIAAITVDRSVPAATANRAILTQLPASNSGGCAPLVMVGCIRRSRHPIAAYNRDARIMRAVPQSALPHRCQEICRRPALDPRLGDDP